MTIDHYAAWAPAMNDALPAYQKPLRLFGHCLSDLSETDIPISTLKRWWIEAKKKRLENQPNAETTENDNGKGQKEGSASETPLCRMGCGRPV